MKPVSHQLLAGATKILTREEEVELGRAALRGDKRAAQRLVTSNLRFIAKVAFRFQGYADVDELFQEGCLGAMKATEKFDPERGIRFISYSVWWIKAYIQNFIIRDWSLVRFGTTQNQRRLFFKFRSIIAEAEKDGEVLTDAEVAEIAEVSEREVRDMRGRLLSGRDASLNAPITAGDEDSGEFIDTIQAPADEAPDALVFEKRSRTDLRKELAAALRGLNNPKMLEIIELRHLADEDEMLTLNELGQHFGFSRERARQLEQTALKRLRKQLRATG
jgi:RNA polymerase sigma-32 factor